MVDHIKNGNIDGLIETFREWRENTPDIRKIVDKTIYAFDFSPDMRKIITKAAELAAEPNPNKYHNNEHFLEVFVLAAALGNHVIQKKKTSVNDIGLLLTAALVHDYKHDGGKNGNVPYRLEKIAFENARPYLEKAGANLIELQIIRALILSTDVNKDFSDDAAISPAESVKQYMITADPNNPFSELCNLYKYKVSDIALILQDADIGVSILCPDFCREGTKNLIKESGNNPKDFPPSILSDLSSFFLDKICSRQLYSSAGRALLQPYMEKVLKIYGLDDRSKSWPPTPSPVK